MPPPSRDVQQFFRTYYTPSNAVLLVLGDVTPAEAFALARRHFDDIPAGLPRPVADTSEAPFEGERRGEVEEKFGTLPGIAVGYRAPERRTPDWYALAMLDQALARWPRGPRLSPAGAGAANRRRYRRRHPLPGRRPVRLQRADAAGFAHALQAGILARTDAGRL